MPHTYFLALTVIKAERPEEESQYDMVGEDGGGGPSLGERRVVKVRELLSELQATSVCDVGDEQSRLGLAGR